jgi:1-acyl-sn-glycerol-3-phosphate acyltransferase
VAGGKYRELCEMKFFYLLRALLLLVIIPTFTIACSILTIFILAPFTNRRVCDHLIKFWAKGLCFLSGIKVNLVGLEHIDINKPYILVSNHLGLYDIPVLFSVIPLSFRMAAKAELFKIPFFGLAMKATGFFPVSRDHSEGSKIQLQKVLKRFQNRESFWLAPEGTRFNGIGVGEFKLGAFFLAQKSDTEILPIAIYGTQYVLPKHSFLVNMSRLTQEVSVEVLQPVAPNGFDSLTRHSLRDHVRNQIVESFFQAHQLNQDRRHNS